MQNAVHQVDQAYTRMTTRDLYPGKRVPQVSPNEGHLEPEMIFSDEDNVKSLWEHKSLSYSSPLTYFTER